VGLIDDKRECIGLGMFKEDVASEDTLNTDSTEVLDAAIAPLDELVETSSAVVSPGVYQKLPEGTFSISQAWSGDVLLGVSYLPEGEGPEVLGFWSPPVTTVGNDMFAVLADAEKPVLAHAFINYLLTAENAQLNYEYVGYQPALLSPSPDELVAAELVPANLMSSLVTEQELADGLRQYTLDAEAETRWEEAWSEFTAG
jgi:spermidine/putrescine transport system substrate-binding protein